MTTGENTLPVCPACGSSDTAPVLEAKDYTVSQRTFTIHQCRQCSLRFTFPVPNLQDIGAYYQSENYISHTDTHKGMINKLYHLVRKFALQQKKNHVVKATGLANGAILDIGSGTGSFLNKMKQAGWQTTGIEPDQNARLVAQAKYQITPHSSEQLFQLPEQSFDAITLWHVLEHVHHLHDYLEQIHKLLKPGGKLLIAVPNYTSFDASHYKAYWAAYDVPRHLYHFSPQSLTHLAEAHQLYLSQQIVMPFDAFYISLLSEKYQYNKTNYLRGFLTGLRSWLHANKEKSRASSITYVFHK